MRGECGASEGKSACTRLTVNHRGLDHRSDDGYQWPACSQHCMLSHVHGGYRLHLGMDLGPKSARARVPGRDRPSRRAGTQCRICLALDVELDGGRCADKAKCAERMAPLF